MLSTDVSHLTVPEKTAAALRELTGELRPDVALQLVIRNAVECELAQVAAGMRAFETKYQMTFDEYRLRWEREDCVEDYRWEAERDYLEWEALAIRQVRLSDICGWLV
jgi:hypothetical protein